MKSYKFLYIFLFILLVNNFNKIQAQNINTPNKVGPMGTMVNTATGNLFIARNDVYVPSRSLDINLGFSYNSYDYDKNIGFGNGWGCSYVIKYRNDGTNTKTIVWGDDREDSYTLNGGSYTAPVGFFNNFSEYQPNKFLLAEQDGTKYYFDDATNKRITKLEEPNGNFISFSYTDTLLTAITTNAGQTISLNYNNAGNLINVTDAITSPTRNYAYTYDAYNNLTKATDPLNGAMQYTYLPNGPMKTMTDKNNNTINIIYNANYSCSEIIGCNKRQSYSYSALLTLVTDYLQDGNNQLTKYEYSVINGQKWLTKLSGNCCGFNRQFEYDANGNKIKDVDAKGLVTKYTYDTKGNILTETNPLGQVMTYTYSSNFNRITSYTDYKGNVTTLTYDAKGNMIQLTEPGNLNYNATYNANGDIVSSTDPKGNTYTYNYDSYGNPTTVTGPNGYNATIAMDAHGNMLSYKDARNNTTTFQYDILDRVKLVTDPLNQQVAVSYDAESNITSAKNQNNEVASFNYDASNRLVKTTDAVGNKSYVAYDAMDNILETQNAIGSKSKFNYDNLNRVVGGTDMQGNTFSLDYDANGNIANIFLPNGNHKFFTYDNLDRVIQEGDNVGNNVNIQYDANGNVSQMTNANGATVSYAYDNLNRVKSITDPLGNNTSFNYDNNGLVTDVTDKNGNTTTYTYDANNRVKTSTDAIGGTVKMNYDAQGNMIEVKDQNNNSTTYSYDELNRPKRTTYPDGKYTEVTYDNKSNVIAKRLTDGSSIAIQYDSLNRPINKTLPDGQIFTYTYDALGRVQTATNNTGTITFTYDNLNRLTSENFDGKTTSYSYDVPNRTQTTTYPDGTTIVKFFDTRNRLTAVSKNGQNIVNFQYNNLNLLTSKTYANGVVTTYQYDIANRLINLSTANGTIQNISYTYDKLGNKKTIVRNNNLTNSEEFGYDANYRLTNFKKGIIGGAPNIANTYTYDLLGNRTTANLNGIATNYTSNNLNQMTNVNNGTQNINFTFDNNGNQTYNGNFYKKYDAEGRLVLDSASPTNKITYEYDALGRRTRKTKNGYPIKYGYSGLAQIELRDGNTDTILTKTVFANFLMPLLNEKNNKKYFYHPNELGSVENITSNGGNSIETYQYNPYGNTTIQDSANNIITNSATGNRFGFTGQELDAETNDYHFFYRNYNTSIGTFGQRDLIGYGDGMGMYQYVGNNPVNGVDVLGLEDNFHSIKNYLNFGNIAQSAIGLIDSRATQNGLAIVTGPGNDELQAEFNTVNDAIVISDEEFNNEIVLMRDRMIELAKTQNYYQIGGNWDSKWHTGNLQQLHIDANQKFCLKGKIYYGHEINYFFLGMLTSYFGRNGTIASHAVNTPLLRVLGYKPDGRLEGRVIGDTWKFLHYNQIMSQNTTDLYHLGFSMESSGEIGMMRNQAMSSFGLPDMRSLKPLPKTFTLNVVSPNGRSGTRNLRGIYTFKTNTAFIPSGLKPDCPQNVNTGGTKKAPVTPPNAITPILHLLPKDPNLIIGPNGVDDSIHWVSVNDRLPYTVLFENAKSASAPAKYIKISVPVQPKQDASTFQLGSFGFNSLNFIVPPNTPSYYKRLDVRDSLGIFVDAIAGFDPSKNEAFWEFTSIDPVTLQPTTEPLVGLLSLQDSSKPNSGHGYVNFSIKPKTTDVTRDSILAQASIVFDTNDTIPTNIHKNTIDAVSPTTLLMPIVNGPSTLVLQNPIHLNWTSTDDPNGSGVQYFTLFISTDAANYSILKSGITRTDTALTLTPGTTYNFFVLATDSTGNTETLNPAQIQSVTISSTALPVTLLSFTGNTVEANNILNWATASEQNSKDFILERSLNGIDFAAIATIPAAGNSISIKNYQYTDINIDKLNSAFMFYRLKQVDINGSSKYSIVIRLQYNKKGMTNSIVYPNPTQGFITIVIGDKNLIGTHAIITDVNGRILQQIKIMGQSQTLDLSGLANSIYFIQLHNNELLKIIKN